MAHRLLGYPPASREWLTFSRIENVREWGGDRAWTFFGLGDRKGRPVGTSYRSRFGGLPNLCPPGSASGGERGLRGLGCKPPRAFGGQQSDIEGAQRIRIARGAGGEVRIASSALREKPQCRDQSSV